MLSGSGSGPESDLVWAVGEGAVRGRWPRCGSGSLSKPSAARPAELCWTRRLGVACDVRFPGSLG